MVLKLLNLVDVDDEPGPDKKADVILEKLCDLASQYEEKELYWVFGLIAEMARASMYENLYPIRARIESFGTVEAVGELALDARRNGNEDLATIFNAVHELFAVAYVLTLRADARKAMLMAKANMQDKSQSRRARR